MVVAVYKATATFPREEQYGLTSQLRRAAVSVAANIVEGAARHTDSEFVHFLNIAYGSLAETGYYIDLAHRLEFLHHAAHTALVPMYEETSRMLNGLMRSVRAHP